MSLIKFKLNKWVLFFLVIEAISFESSLSLQPIDAIDAAAVASFPSVRQPPPSAATAHQSLRARTPYMVENKLSSGTPFLQVDRLPSKSQEMDNFSQDVQLKSRLVFSRLIYFPSCKTTYATRTNRLQPGDETSLVCDWLLRRRRPNLISKQFLRGSQTAGT